MTNEQIAERVLNDVFSRAGSGRPADVIPMAVFAAATAYVSLRVLPDDVRTEINRQILLIQKIMDEKIEKRASSHSLITPLKQ